MTGVLIERQTSNPCVPIQFGWALPTIVLKKAGGWCLPDDIQPDDAPGVRAIWVKTYENVDR